MLLKTIFFGSVFARFVGDEEVGGLEEDPSVAVLEEQGGEGEGDEEEEGLMLNPDECAVIGEVRKTHVHVYIYTHTHMRVRAQTYTSARVRACAHACTQEEEEEEVKEEGKAEWTEDSVQEEAFTGCVEDAIEGGGGKRKWSAEGGEDEHAVSDGAIEEESDSGEDGEEMEGGRKGTHGAKVGDEGNEGEGKRGRDGGKVLKRKKRKAVFTKKKLVLRSPVLTKKKVVLKSPVLRVGAAASAGPACDSSQEEGSAVRRGGRGRGRGRGGWRGGGRGAQKRSRSPDADLNSRRVSSRCTHDADDDGADDDGGPRCYSQPLPGGVEMEIGIRGEGEDMAGLSNDLLAAASAAAGALYNLELASAPEVSCTLPIRIISNHTIPRHAWNTLRRRT